jgi:uncharacterized protein (DUF1684 family)
MRVLLLLLAILGAVDTPASYRAEIEKYRRERLAELTAPNGWLAVRGLFWLHEGANTAGSDPTSEIRLPARAPKRLGVFTLKDRVVRFTADPSATVTAAGKPIETYTFEGRGGERSAITAAGLSLFVLRRSDRIGLRLLDPESVPRKTFPGLKYFPLDPAFRFKAKFIAYSALKEVPVPNVLGQLVPMQSPGYVEFVLKGRTYRLEPVYETATRSDLFFIFKDQTSRGGQTYEAGRFLHTPLPVDGVVDLDFNRAYNPPCAFTAFATCPLPVKENHLQVAIRAGELNYHLPK